ncbi:aminopeptidase [Streptomyces badius]
MPGENLSRDEAQKRAELLTVDGYEVALDLRSAVGRPEGADGDGGPLTFRSLTTIRFRSVRACASTFADLVAPGVDAVTLNGKALDPAVVFDGTRVALDGLLEGENVLVVDARCAYSRTGEGMHRFVDPEDGEVYLYTQYEPADARRVFANFEQPDLKAPYRFEVTAPQGWRVWSNGAEESREGGVWRFAETKPISTYITAVVAGPYHYVSDHYSRTFADGTTLDIPLGAMCRKGLAKHFDADDVFLVTKQGLDFFHDNFDYPYPFGKYDQAFVPEYNLGAMENPGMVTFREEYIYRGKVTSAADERRANVILHEMAHMWFGDLVTMEWWDDLWLKESFADFMGSFSMVESTRFTNGWVTFANNRKAWAYRADQLPSTHPITADIRDLQERQAELRRDHVRQGRLLRQAARGVRGAGRVPGGRAALLQAARVRQHQARGPAVGAGRDLGPGHDRLVAFLAPDGGRQHAHPGARVRRGGRPHRAGRRPGGRRLAPGTAPAPGRGRPVPAYARGRADAVRARRGGRGRRADRGGGAGLLSGPI